MLPRGIGADFDLKKHRKHHGRVRYGSTPTVTVNAGCSANAASGTTKRLSFFGSRVCEGSGANWASSLTLAAQRRSARRRSNRVNAATASHQ